MTQRLGLLDCLEMRSTDVLTLHLLVQVVLV